MAEFPKNRPARVGLKKLLFQQIKKPSETIAPPQSKVQAIIELYNAGRLQEVVVQGEQLARQFPNYLEIHNILGAANLNLGRAEETLKNYRRAIEINPRFSDAHNNMGTVLYHQGNLDQAIESYHLAIEIEPGFADAYYNMGNAFKQKGDLTKAAENYRKSLLYQPDDVEVLIGYGNALAADGNINKAIEIYQRALQIQPDLVDAQMNLAKALTQKAGIKILQDEGSGGADLEINSAEYHRSLGIELAGKGAFDTAVASYTRALQVKPDDAEVHNDLGLVLVKMGKIRAAEKNFERAIEIKPDFADGHFNLGNCLLKQENFEGAIARYQAAIAFNKAFAEAHNNLGNAFSKNKQTDLAVKSYEAALAIKPNYTDAHLNMGSTHLEAGGFSAAITSYEQALQSEPKHAEAHSFLAYVRKYDGSEDHIRQMKDLYYDVKTSDDDMVHLGFALGKVFEDALDFKMSFQFLQQGNHLRKVQLQYDIAQDRKLFSQIKTMFETRPTQPIKLPVGTHSKQPVFIVGMPRSGTSLVEQVLSSHSMIYGAGELETLERLIHQFNPFQGYFSAVSLAKLGQTYIGSVNEAKTSKPLVSDKMPLNFRWIGFILSAFPDAKIIHVGREPQATCWSIFKQYFWSNGNGYAYDMQDLCAYYKMYLNLMNFWHSKYPGKIYDLNYEHLTENQERESRTLISYLDLNWEDQCLEFHKTKRSVKTASNLQVREKMYTGSSQKWRQYEPYLAEMVDALKGC